MIIFLYGPDSYRRRQKLKEIVSQYKEKRQSLGFFDFESEEPEEEFSRLREFCASYSLFENVKLAVVNKFLNFAKELSAKEAKKTVEFLKSNLKNKELTILLSEEKAPLKIFDFLLKNSILVQEFENLSVEQLKSFIKKEAEKREIKLSADAVMFLAGVFNGNIWSLINELDKLSLVGDKNFNTERLREIIDDDKPAVGNEFFKQVSALSFSRSLPQKIVNLEILLNKEDPARIFNVLASFSSNPPDLIRKFADYDIVIKSGKMDYEEVLVDFSLNGY